ncbi:hypothetical protein AWQ21_14330 [Picosynechococcus sp. PCC 7003]|uniref:mannan-binding protein n=1 Tax=Picosynechococcus sp. PCC 7003 TaxID=374981 RepID=UPI000810C7AB|nr:mannan-binding protein [Picosynechococcus sp. PCC 7003]ANV85425.1 hypothetical protein AWQ21_14330 [Picosynechococcus sp. PCC 7003]
MFNKLSRFSFLATSTISFIFSLSLPASANTTRAVEAGPIWNQNDANVKCPRLAQEEGGTWTGQWWTTISGVMSVCQLEFLNNLETKSFSLLNYNVMLLSRNIPSQGNLMQDYRAQEIATAIRNSDPWDVIVINEAFDNEARNKLSRRLKEVGYSFITEVVDTNNGKLEDGGVYLQSRWPIMATDQIIFSACNGFDCQSNKGAVYAKIDKEGIIYHIFGTHLQADAGNRNIRANQLRQLETFINQKTEGASSRGEAIIIAGDLNFDYQTAEYDDALETLNAQFLGDIPQDYTFDPRSNDLAKYRYPNDSPEWLDYVLIGNEGIQPNRTTLDIEKFRTASQYELPGKGDFLNLFGGTMVRDLSDHYGLSTSYIFNAHSLEESVNSDNIRLARFANGYLQQTSSGIWTEFDTNGGVAFTFQETGRDNSSVYLNDPTRNLQLQIDVDRRMISFGMNNGPKRDLYSITSVSQ